MDKRMHLKAGIDPDGTPHSKFINELMLQLLQKTPNPDDQPAPDEQHRAEIILGALVNVNAGVIANIMADPTNRLAVMGVISQLSGEVFEEVARLQPQVEASRKPKQ